MDLYDMLEEYINGTLKWETHDGKEIPVFNLNDKHIENILALDRDYDMKDAWQLILKIEQMRREGCDVDECREEDFVPEDTKTYDDPAVKNYNSEYTYGLDWGNYISMSVKAYYQLCPKCHGQGVVSKPPYIAGDINTWTSSATETYTCPVCHGSGVLLVKEEQK